MDALRKTHGAKAISLGPFENIPGGYVGAKIAFGRIPDEEDFSEVSADDEVTQSILVLLKDNGVPCKAMTIISDDKRG